jgi:cell division protein ZapE
MLHVPKALKGVAVFSFKRLCGEARGAADYLAIAHASTRHLSGFPVLTRDKRNEAARSSPSSTRSTSIASSSSPPPTRNPALYPEGDGGFEFQRTVSRLEEMQSADYLGEGHGLHED